MHQHYLYPVAGNIGEAGQMTCGFLDSALVGLQIALGVEAELERTFLRARRMRQDALTNEVKTALRRSQRVRDIVESDVPVRFAKHAYEPSTK
jgi:hypothetical protein